MRTQTKTFLIAISIAMGTALGVHIVYALLTYCAKERAYKIGKEYTHELRPERGRIVDIAGNVMAKTDTVYDVHFDPMVWGESHRDTTEWESKLRDLASCLADSYPERDAIDWFKYIKEGHDRGRRYLSIAKSLSKERVDTIKSFPLFNLPSYRGGLIIEPRYVRKYPFGSMARRTVGYMNGDSLKIGLEKSYDQFLSGHPGHETIRYGRYEGEDIQKIKKFMPAQNGMNIQTTLSMNVSSIADSILRTTIQTHNDVEAGCFVLMNVKTGAIHVMTNLTKTEDGIFELNNYAISRTYEPGSLAQAMTFAALLSDGHLHSLHDTIPTNHGMIPNLNQDAHIVDYERSYSAKSIAIREGFAISSRYVPAYLAQKFYSQKPEEFIDHLLKYCPEIDFDLYGLSRNRIPTPKSQLWTNNTLPVLSYGYSMSVSPLLILTFYSSIANKGRMMKPYLVEQISKYDGKVIATRGPSIMGQVMPEHVADSLSEALKYVTKEGPGRTSKHWNQMIVGKSGISLLPIAEGAEDDIDVYHDREGLRKYAASYVGYFPQENPEYSAICVLFSEKTKQSFYAGSLPAIMVRDFVNRLVK